MWKYKASPDWSQDVMVRRRRRAGGKSILWFRTSTTDHRRLLLLLLQLLRKRDGDFLVHRSSCCPVYGLPGSLHPELITVKVKVSLLLVILCNKRTKSKWKKANCCTFFTVEALKLPKSTTRLKIDFTKQALATLQISSKTY